MVTTPKGFTALAGTTRVTATAVVFDVTHDGGGGLVYVCKRLGDRARDEEWVRQRLVAEGALLRRLDGHPTPRLFAAGEDAAGPWIVMGRVSGQTLAAAVGRAEPWWLARAARACFEALRALHAAGVVHGDLNPDNVILAEDAHTATILDLGLARWDGAPPMPPGPFRGTLAYAAPEEARGEELDARADLFGIAAALLHAASGTLPRTQDTPAAMLLAAGDQGIEAWAESAARSLPPAVAEVLVRCCTFDRAGRPPTAGDVVAALA